MKHLVTLSFFLVTAITAAKAQSLAINTTGALPNASAILDVSSTNKGVLIPRMTAAQRLGIANPAVGLQVFQTDGTPGIQFFNGSTWVALAAGTSFTQGTGINIANGVISATNQVALWNASKLQGKDINTTAPVNGQVLQFNSAANKWQATTPASGSVFTAGTGIGIASNVISAATGNALWNANKLQGKDVNSAAPGNGQVLQFSTATNRWQPTTLAANNNTGWNLTGNTATDPALNFIGTTNAADFKLATNGIGRVTIKSSGEVGIGTNSPSAFLGLVRSNNVSQPILRIDDGTSNTAIPTVLLFNNGSNKLVSGSTLGNGIMMDLSRDGGGTNTAEGLKVSNQGSGAAILGFNKSGTGSGVTGFSNDAEGGVFTSVNGTGLFVSGKRGAIIRTNGDGDGLSVEVVNNQSGRFSHVTGVNVTIKSPGVETHVIGIASRPVSTGSEAHVVGFVAEPRGTPDASIDCFEGVGDMIISGNIFSFSDKRLKNNIQPMQGMMKRIMELSPATYLYKKKDYDLNLPAVQQNGLIAQELQKVFPELVAEKIIPANIDEQTKQVISGERRFLGVNYLGLVPILISGMQEQQQAITALQESNVQLAKENEILKGEIRAIKAKLGL